MSDFKIVSLLNPSVVVLSGATGPAIGAGTSTQTSGTVVFGSSAGNVTFGMSNGYVTASAPAGGGGGGGGIALGAGSQTATTGTVAFANSNGISFGMSGSNQITASYTVPTQSVQTQASGAIAGTGFTSTTTAGTAVVGTMGTGGLSLGVPAFLTTSPVQTVQPVAFSASGGSSNFSTLQFSNQGNDVTFLNSAGQVAMSHSLQPLSNTSAITANAVNTSVSSLFQQTSATSAITSNAFPSANTTKFAGTGTTFAGTNVSATVGLDSNGLNLALSAPTPGGGAAVNFSAGTTSGNLQSVVFSNGNGVSFGLNGSTITGSVAPGGGGGIAAAAGTQTATSGTINFVNSNNITFGMSNSSQITASFSQSVDTNKAGTGFTSASTAGTDIVGTLNTNGLSIGVPKYITTYAAQSVQTQASGNIAGIGFTSTTTAGVVPAATLGTNGLSFAAPNWITTYVNDLTSGRAGTGTTLAFAGGVTGSMTLNTNGLNLSLSELAGTDTWYATGANTIAGTATSGTFSDDGYVVSGAGGVSIGVSSNTLVISGPTGGGGTTNQTGPNIAVAGSTITSGTVVFANSNGVTFGLNGQTMTASAAGGGGGAATQSRWIGPANVFTTITSATASAMNGSLVFGDEYLPVPVSGTAIGLVHAHSVQTSYNVAQTISMSVSVGIYTKVNDTQISLYTSNSTSYQITWSSSTTSGIMGGNREIYVPMNFTLPAGEIVVARWMSFSTNTSNANSHTISFLGAPHMTGAGVDGYGVASNASGAPFLPWNGVYTSTTNAMPATVSRASIIGASGAHGNFYREYRGT